MRKACRYPLYLSIHQFQQRSQDTCYQADEFIPRPLIFCTPTNGKTLLGFRGTFPRAGKPCSDSEGHFPGRENLAALVGNVFPGGETLPRSWGTFSRAGKPCCILRQHFYEHGNLAAFCGRVSTIICSPPSFPFRPHQGVCDTPLHFPAKYLHKTAPSITVPSMNKW